MFNTMQHVQKLHDQAIDAESISYQIMQIIVKSQILLKKGKCIDTIRESAKLNA